MAARLHACTCSTTSVAVARATSMPRTAAPAAPHLARLRQPQAVALEPLRPMQQLCQALDHRTARQYINQLEGWELQEDAAGALHLRRTWLASSFGAAVELCGRIAALAASEGRACGEAGVGLSLTGRHRVTASLWTDVRRGVTENDFMLASKLEKMSKEGLLRCPQTKLPASE